MAVFELILRGYDGNTDATDHLVKWVKAPTFAAIQQFLRHRPDVTAVLAEVSPIFEDEPPDWQPGFADGVDLELDDCGVVIGQCTGDRQERCLERGWAKESAEVTARR